MATKASSREPLRDSTRGDLAHAIFTALGLTETSGGGAFSDAGYLDGITTSLKDLGITNGIGGGKFGTSRTTTRGEAFTMIARAMGLADASTSIEDASRALVDAGIVKGYGDNPNNLGLDDPLRSDHLDLLVGRVAPQIQAARDDGSSIASDAAAEVDAAAKQNKAKKDPTYAAYLASVGVSRDRINDELDLRDDLYNQDSLRRSETYGRAAERAVGGTQMDFENRGLYRSGTRIAKEADQRAQVGYQEEQAALQALIAKQQADARDNSRLADLDTDEAEAELTHDATQAGNAIAEDYA